MLDTYASKYHDLKAPRKLKWKPALGSVTMSVRVGADTVDLTVTPLHATIIMHFQARRAGLLMHKQPSVSKVKRCPGGQPVNQLIN